MANKDGHRRFGTVRQRASGRWQARYPGPDGRLRSAPDTFERKRDAERYLTLIEGAMAKGEWTDPVRARVRLQDYAERWIEQRPGLRPSTVAFYRWTLKKHVTPYLGAMSLGNLDTPLIREWRAKLLAEGVSPGMVAKAYRLLRAVLWTAVKEDELLPRNPCRIPGADNVTPEERPTLTLAQVQQLASAVPPRYSVMILVAVFASLRYGEVTALERQDVDLVAGTIRVRQQHVEVAGRGLVLGPPKSRAGLRVVAVPARVVAKLRAHLAEYVLPGRSALVFARPSGAPILRPHFNKLVSWSEAVAAVGAPGLHFHDLRHTGNVLAAGSGVSTRDLMTRMGHDSMRAALIYQHASREADRSIADHLDAALGAIDDDDEDGDGTAGVLVPVG
jgi:integrase